MRVKDPLKKAWYRWRSRQSPFTLGDFYIRDRWFLFHLSKFAYRYGVTANMVTGLGWFLLALWFVLREFYYGERSPWLDFWFISLIGFTDFVDGPLARNNDDVTVEGTLADYFRDLAFLVYMTFLALEYAMPIFFFWAIAGIELAALLIKFAAFLWYCAGPRWRDKFLEFAVDNFQGSIEDRLQFGLLYFGIPYLMFGEFKKIFFFIQTGYVLIWLSLGVGIVVIIKELGWSPPSAEEN